VTREPFRIEGRIDALIDNGRLFGHPLTGPGEFDPATDRIMMCGSMAMIRDLQARFLSLGFKEGSNAAPGDFVIERAFVG
jgi:ferredoxin--NADP+ reductase